MARYPHGVEESRHPSGPPVGPLIGPLVGRRRFLAGGAAVSLLPAVLPVAGCDAEPTPTPTRSKTPTPTPTPTPKPDPDQELLEQASEAERGLVATYEATLDTHPALADLLDPLLAHHLEHLAYLSDLAETAAAGPLPTRFPTPPTAAPRTTPTDGVSPAVPGSRARALNAVVAAETGAAEARVAELEGARSAEVARLLAVIGACESSHARYLERAG